MARIGVGVFYSKAKLQLHWLPIIASVTWFSTLTILLLRWLYMGRPRYPGQVNPYIPFISDIGAFHFKPVFVIGCTITSITFVGTVFAVHYVRYSASFYGLVDDVWWRKATSMFALVTGAIAGTCLLLLSIFDTLESHEKHLYLLTATFGALGLSSLATEAVWWDETWSVARFPGLRKWCIVNTILVVFITGVGISFQVLIYTDYSRSAGIMEWTITYLGALWMGTFAGYIRFRERDLINGGDLEAERQPLLTSPSLDTLDSI